MKEGLSIKQKHAKKSCLLTLVQRQEYDSGAVWWSPGSLREARVGDEVFRREECQPLGVSMNQNVPPYRHST
jgi:hypothetical protein